MIAANFSVLLAALLVTSAVAVAEAERPSNDPLPVTTSTDDPALWLGGFGSLDDFQLSWNTASMELENWDSAFEGKLKAENRTYSVSISPAVENENIQLVLERRNGPRQFSGRMAGGVLSVTAEDGKSPNRLIMRQVHPLSPEERGTYTGIYTARDGCKMSFRSGDSGLSMTNYRTGKIRLLYPVERDKFVAGPAIAIPDPVEFEFQFFRDDDQNVTSVEIRQKENQSIIATRRAQPRTEEFSYASFDGTKINGSLFRPHGPGPFPAIVWVHGSGKATRQGAGSWPMYFANLGFAVLAVDKRGVGKSEGNYQMPGGGRDNFPHMRRRSKDVAAAVDALARLDDIRSDQIGLVGASQAGWVIPMTVGQAKIAFAIVLSGGATPLSVEGRYSRMASERSSGSNLLPIDELIDELRSYEPDDEGIDSELIQMDYPCLWLYGYRDRSNPSQLCVQRITDIGHKHDRDFTVKTFADGNHGLLVCRYGGGAEFGTLDRLVPGLYDGIEAWLIDRKLMPKQEN